MNDWEKTNMWQLYKFWSKTLHQLSSHFSTQYVPVTAFHNTVDFPYCLSVTLEGLELPF